jgi:hypothetical protein
VIAALVAAIALTVSPARVDLVAGGTQVVRVTNAGSVAAVLDVTRAGFALSLRGQPRIVKAQAAWLAFAPRRLVVEPGGSATFTVTSHPRRLAPGDHPGLLLLTQRPVVRGGLAVRTRVGVVVSLRVPGRVVHRLLVSGVRVAGRRVQVSLANRGNVTELLSRSVVTVTLWRGQRLVARFRPATRELLPGAKGLLELRYAGRVRGPVTARVEILAAGGRKPVKRAFQAKL